VPHSVTLITTIAAGLGLALIMGFIAVRLKVPALVASDPAVLIQAHIARARMLVIATPDAFQARKMIGIARMLNPGIDTVVRIHDEEEAELLRKENVGKVFMGEHELALGMTRHVLERIADESE